MSDDDGNTRPPPGTDNGFVFAASLLLGFGAGSTAENAGVNFWIAGAMGLVTTLVLLLVGGRIAAAWYARRRPQGS